MGLEADGFIRGLGRGDMGSAEKKHMSTRSRNGQSVSSDPHKYKEALSGLLFAWPPWIQES